MNNKIEEIRKYLDETKYGIKEILVVIENLCKLIEHDDNEINDGNIKELGLILKMRDFGEEKDKIVDLLIKYSRNSKKPRVSNIFLNEAEILQRKIILKSKPREIHVTITFKCNLKCIMCCNGYDTEYELDDQLYEYLVDNMKYLERVIWKGGEVFLYKNFFKLFDLAAKYNVKQTIITNGLLLNKDIIEHICKNNVSLSVSIDAVDKELYEKIRVGGRFEKLIENLTILKNIREKNKNCNYSMITVLMTLNYNKILDFVNFAKLYDFSSIHFSKCDPGKENKGIPFLLQEKHLLEIYKQFNEDYMKEILDNKEEIYIEIDNSFIIGSKNIESKQYNNYGEKKIDGKKEELEKKEEKENIKYNSVNKEVNFDKLFCDLPWKKVIFSIDNIGFDCHCKVIDISKYLSKKTDIWNCEELVEYRKNIIDNKEKSCKIFLENSK